MAKLASSKMPRRRGRSSQRRRVSMSAQKPPETTELEPASEPDPSQREIQWRQYALHVDIYKFHVDSTIKVNGFVFLVTGGVMGYVLNGSKSIPAIAKLALVLPVLLSTGLALVMGVAAIYVQKRKEEVETLRKELGLSSALNLTLLQFITGSFAVIHVVVAIGLTVAMVLMLLGKA
jgi:hypothetical protein